jgi:hypothetical protein
MWGCGLDWAGSGSWQLAGICEWGNGPSGFHKMRGISLLAENRLGFQEGLCSMEWVSDSYAVNCIKDWLFLRTVNRPRIFHWHNPSGHIVATGVVDSTSNRNEYQEYFVEGKSDRCVELTSLPPSCAVYLEIIWATNFWSLQRLFGLVKCLLYILPFTC